ncbi:nitrous oxide reductase family maturation protein NosD [Leptospira fainei serovar Hurstbridge str. BUT 6]|uniref:Nitrous oxide reductase family maturation protein NosD n=1 Tax=Leptospira fainei serovar Hurstbridge str. BUT 6 TaxID=1193011 RepID=S3W3Z0_9LEPT|nr:nitrous oxide reductase family maturation protein NosD [Leptospira fainei]EPG75002.1 nitrous oxide reductase family maturation protein NosD [Leptospira fainei serovar Hurstbridge str. BUT 6]
MSFKIGQPREQNPSISIFGKSLRGIILFVLILFGKELFSREITVCSDCAISSVRNAIDKSQDGDSIIIKAGLYREGEILVNKRISIVGLPGAVIDGKKEKHVFEVASNGVTIRGLKIMASGISDTAEYAGIHAQKITDCTFANNTFEDNAYAIYLAEVGYCQINDNITRGNARNEVSGGNGVHLWNSKSVQIIGNRAEKHRDGIYLEFSSNLKIENNVSRNNIRYGMHFMFSSDNDFRGNTFESNSAGVAVMYSKNILIEDNTFRNNWGESSYGLLLKEISDSILVKNKFIENSTAIFADGCNRNYFTHNSIEENGWGIRILGSSDSNVFSKNDFRENVFDISTNAKQTTNKFSQNYWDSYRGYDLDGDKIGDAPHQPIHFFGYWVAIYPFLMVLYESPVVTFLQGIENAFPIVTPIDFEDPKPTMKGNI